MPHTRSPDGGDRRWGGNRQLRSGRYARDADGDALVAVRSGRRPPRQLRPPGPDTVWHATAHDARHDRANHQRPVQPVRLARRHASRDDDQPPARHRGLGPHGRSGRCMAARRRGLERGRHEDERHDGRRGPVRSGHRHPRLDHAERRRGDRRRHDHQERRRARLTPRRARRRPHPRPERDGRVVRRYRPTSISSGSASASSPSIIAARPTRSTRRRAVWVEARASSPAGWPRRTPRPTGRR